MPENCRICPLCGNSNEYFHCPCTWIPDKRSLINSHQQHIFSHNTSVYYPIPIDYEWATLDDAKATSLSKIMLFTGGCGTGKTHAMWGISKYLNRVKKLSLQYIYGPDIPPTGGYASAWIQEHYNPGKMVCAIDDYTDQCLPIVLDRSGKNLVTLITSRGIPSSGDDKLSSRLNSGKIVSFIGPDKRGRPCVKDLVKQRKFVYNQWYQWSIRDDLRLRSVQEPWIIKYLRQRNKP